MKRLARSIRKTLRPMVYAGKFIVHRLKPLGSYADDREDVIAWTLLGGIDRFIDIGANDGRACSNTALAALRGACGMCFEPNPLEYSRLAAFYRYASKVECVAQALSDRSGFVELRSDGLLSAITATEDVELSALLAGARRNDASLISVPVERLSVWLDRRPEFQRSDLLSIDVEGHELRVLQGIDWNRHPKPGRCLVIETHAVGESRQWRHRDFEAIDLLLAQHGYRKVAASRNNTFWLHCQDCVATRMIAAKSRFNDYTWFDDASHA